MLDEESEIFVVHIAVLETLLTEMIIHPLRKTQVAFLKQDEGPNQIFRFFRYIFRRKNLGATKTNQV